MKSIAAVIGVACLSPVLLAGTAAVAAAGSAGRSTNCSSDKGLDTATVAKAVEAILGGKGGASQDVHVEGLELPAEQIPHAKTIVATGISLRVPERGQVVALATAIQESRLRNLSGGDRDSLGLFQQRPSQGWGTPEQIRDPVYAATKFYKRLLEVRGWEQMTITQAAQAVQRSGLPDAYAQWEPLARALQQAIVKTLPGGNGTPGTGGTQPPATSGCAGGGDLGPILEGAVPDGYEIPKDAPEKVRTAIRWSMGQLGTMYQWGGTCTNSHGPDPMGRCDCSSLTQQSYKTAGITLTRTTYTQVKEGDSVPASAIRPGDLLFTRPGPSGPEHVAMAIGTAKGTLLAIEAPRTGKPVRIVTQASLGTIIAVQRMVPAS
ncbi:C40 family peptidase [Streptomyces sp. NBC_00160]|uniref:C40 family peptidase n=1 Tax=Streptomyces sp. NBC_00160 TaxID=2903628 RepID=UPI00225967CF|nr:NlpC/P60 family protein [Streptomyces sp. NBC_00160]MCX5303146.1 C40 family peptidase [Streptomyces sp. NBC_00160]